LVDAVGSAVSDCAYQIQNHHDEFNHALEQAILEALGWAVVFLAIDILSDGLAAAFTGPESELIAGRAAATLTPVAASLRFAVTTSNVIRAAEVAAGVFAFAMANAPEPNIETSDATHLGDQVTRGTIDESESAFNPAEKKSRIDYRARAMTLRH
jgi:hypothetical protein